jgi:hypothetical protein
MFSYFVLTQVTHLSATYAETNLQAGLLKLQTLYDAEDSAATMIGTSMIAKLPTTEVFDGFGDNNINLGIDGGSGLYAIDKLLESGKKPGAVILEVNGLLIMPGANMRTLDDAYRSKTYLFSKWLPVFGKEYRPSSIMYSALKKIKDRSERVAVSDAPLSQQVTVEQHEQKEYRASIEDEVFLKWSGAIERLRSFGCPIVLVMLPDGDKARSREYELARGLADQYGLPLVDLKLAMQHSSVAYTDGTHLNHFSAILAARLLNQALDQIVGQISN